MYHGHGPPPRGYDDRSLPRGGPPAAFTSPLRYDEREISHSHGRGYAPPPRAQHYAPHYEGAPPPAQYANDPYYHHNEGHPPRGYGSGRYEQVASRSSTAEDMYYGGPPPAHYDDPYRMGGYPQDQGYRSRAEYLREEHAARSIQAAWRGRQTRIAVREHMGYEPLSPAAARWGRAAGGRPSYYGGNDDYKRGPNNRPRFSRKAGTVHVQLHGGKGLNNKQCCFDMDPFVRWRFGDEVKESDVVSNGGQAPKFAREPTFHFALGNKALTSIHMDVINKNIIIDDTIGTHEFTLDELEKIFQKPMKRSPYALSGGGDMFLTFKYSPPIRVTILKAEGLIDVQTIGKQDPFCRIIYSGPTPLGDTGARRTKVSRDGHSHPEWNETFTFNVIDQRHFHEENAAEHMDDVHLLIEIINENHLIDDHIGWLRISFAEMYKHKHRARGKPVGYQINKGRHKDGNRGKAGTLYLKLH